MTQRSRLWLVALVVGGLLVALPGAAVAQTDTTTTDTAAVDDHISDIDRIKHRALHAIDKRLHTIHRLAHLVEKSPSVTEEHATKLMRDLRGAAEGLTELARKIRAAETIEELRELVPMIGDFKVYQVLKPKVLQVLASDHVVAVAERLRNLGEKLEMLIDRAEEAGYDVTRPRALLHRMRRNVAAAVELGGPVADKVIDLQPEDWPDPAEELLMEGRRRLHAAAEHLQHARYQARKIIRWLRHLQDPPIDLSELD